MLTFVSQRVYQLVVHLLPMGWATSIKTLVSTCTNNVRNPCDVKLPNPQFVVNERDH